jgi:2-keto-4-pentenoate hydratase/2-oxohepta-3-ene-1,7-dioic acid hydratase in catechol pathway
MRYCRFQTPHGPRHGRIENGKIVELISFHGDYVRVPARGEEFSPVLFKTAQLLAPTEPSKIICVGRNYREHASELGNEVPKEPLIFFKPPSSVIGPGQAIEIPPAELTQRVDYEGELGVIIGKRCRNLRQGEDITPYVRGYTCVNDVTARDLQKTDGQWTRAKGFDTFCPVGPIVVTPDEFDFAHAEVEIYLNGERKQHGRTSDFIFSLAEIIRYISRAMTLEPGDLISTGTPAGVAPMKAGDTVEVRISGLGSLNNPVSQHGLTRMRQIKLIPR